MQRLKGKVAIVTGASKGIGAGIARVYAAEGASVVVNYATGKEGADRVVKEIVSRDGKAVAIQADMSKSADIRRLFAEAKKAFGPLDILVNNAGVFTFDPLEKVTEAEFHRQFNTNVLGPILAIQEAVGHFGPNGGSIVNVGSVVALQPPPASVIYSATKAALASVTRTLALELGARNIRVNTLHPGGVVTEGTRTAGIIGSDFEKQMVARTPLGRLAQPEDIARAALFFASDDSSWVTGDSVVASGGLH